MFRRLTLMLVLAGLLLALPVAAQQSGSNLVVVVSDTPLLGSPGGGALGNAVVRACQTYFAVERSADGAYVRLSITPRFSGWVAVNAVQDVPENYGQRNGSPATCSGAALPVVQSTVTVAAPTAAPVSSASNTTATPAPTSAPANQRITPNLVLVISDTPLLGAPAGNPLGIAVARRCQTFFVVERSADGLYYRLQITPGFTGWVSASAVQDVDENYGQRNGQARAC